MLRHTVGHLRAIGHYAYVVEPVTSVTLKSKEIITFRVDCEEEHRERLIVDTEERLSELDFDTLTSECSADGVFSKTDIWAEHHIFLTNYESLCKEKVLELLHYPWRRDIFYILTTGLAGVVAMRALDHDLKIRALGHNKHDAYLWLKEEAPAIRTNGWLRLFLFFTGAYSLLQYFDSRYFEEPADKAIFGMPVVFTGNILGENLRYLIKE